MKNTAHRSFGFFAVKEGDPMVALASSVPTNLHMSIPSIKKDYGTAEIATNRDGNRILLLPPKLVRSLRVRSGDTVSINTLNAGGFWLQFYRKKRTGWVVLLLGGKTRPVRRPRYAQGDTGERTS